MQDYYTKFNDSGIRVDTHRWISDLLYDRQQQVILHGMSFLEPLLSSLEYHGGSVVGRYLSFYSSMA